MERQPVPYHPGGHCIFYAVQAASLYFYSEPLTIADRDRLKAELKEKNRQIDQISGSGFQVSVEILLRELQSLNIQPNRYLYHPCNQDVVSTIPALNGIPLAMVEGKTDVNYPYLVLVCPPRIIPFLKRTPHVWFCPDEKAEKRDRHRNILLWDNVLFAMEFEQKDQEQT